MHIALEAILEATKGTAFEGDLWLVGGAVRDELLGLPHENDFDLVTRGSSTELAQLLWEKKVSSIPPVTYARFGTAMLLVKGANVEIVTARRESYEETSRKPNVEPATLEEDASRRDFTVNTLMRNLHTGELYDPLRTGLADLEGKVLRTPLEPIATFHDDPLRMLRAVRFRWQLGFTPAPGLYEAIKQESQRLKIISFERIRDEVMKMLGLTEAASALRDLMDLELLQQFAPELMQMKGVDQGDFHHLDVWDHSLLVLDHLKSNDLSLKLAALLHDVAKPRTRTVENGRVRFLGHETQGAEMAREILKRLRLPSDEIDRVSSLVRNHMRLASAPKLSPAAARRLVRDLGDLTEPLLDLIEADRKAHKPGTPGPDMEEVRALISKVSSETPAETLKSPLEGGEIMELLGIPAGPEIGKLKEALAEAVVEGHLEPGDKEGAKNLLLSIAKNTASDAE